MAVALKDLSPCIRPTPAPAAGTARSCKARRARRVELPPLYKYLQEVPDPRDRRGRRHPLAAILALICLAPYGHGYLPAAEWARNLSRRERKKLGFRKGKTPAASTLYEVLQVLSG